MADRQTNRQTHKQTDRQTVLLYLVFEVGSEVLCHGGHAGIALAVVVEFDTLKGIYNGKTHL